MKSAFASLAALLLAASLAAPAAGREISGERTHSGEVVVPKGDTWTVAPGSVMRFRGGRLVVRGRLVVEGSASRPVRIVGDDAFEGIDLRGEDGSRISAAVLSGGRRGISVTSAKVVLRDVRFERNAVGLEVGQYGRAELRDCEFRSPSRVGVLVKRGGALDAASTRFLEAGRSGVYVYGAHDVSIRSCRFEGNATGLHLSMFGATAKVDDSVFSGNGTGLLAEKMAAPAVSGGEFSGNRTGLRFSRRAEGTVTGSRIERNGDGVLVEYSSYPSFRGNRFRGNREYAVRLNHQSSEWEGEADESDREMPGVPGGAPPGGSRSDFRPGGGGGQAGRPASKKASLDGTVDFRGNDWGDDGIERGGPGGRRAVRDALEEPFFDYKGKRYRMDRVAH